MKKVMELIMPNYEGKFTRVRNCCRAVITKDNKILMVLEKKTGTYFLPGGGQEIEESPIQCMVREIEEETGFICLTDYEFLELTCYFHDFEEVNHFFACHIISESGVKHLTEKEVEGKVTPVWLTLEEAKEELSKITIDDRKRGIHLRELTAIKEYILSRGC